MKTQTALHENQKKSNGIAAFFQELFTNKYLYLMAIPGILYFVIFCYIPMFNIIIAFKDYNPIQGVFGSPWVGFKHFIRFFDSVYFGRVMKNTIGLSVYEFIVCFPLPIIFALLINEIRCLSFKKVIQTLTYIPNFISMMVIVGMVTSFTMMDGLINDFIVFFGGERSNLLMRPELFKTIYVLITAWQCYGWSSIIYIAALSNIDPSLYEAAEIDGAGRFRQAISVTLPGILPTVVTMLILQIGGLVNVGFEKVFLLYNDLTLETGEVISTYVYKKGLVEMNYGFSTAVGLFNSVISIILVITANYISRKVTETSLW